MIIYCETTSKIEGNTYKAWSNALARLANVPDNATIKIEDNGDTYYKEFRATWKETR